MKCLWIIYTTAILSFALPTVKGNFGSDDSWESPFAHLLETACEGYPIHLQCPGTDVVEVISAEYGRLNRDTCVSDTMRDLNCRLLSAGRITSARCNNRTSCRLPVSSDNFPDPCPGTSKYLQVRYRCVKYMFGCPGTLVGIGSNSTVQTSLSPEAGSWTRDPIDNPEHVFFARKSGQGLEEYASMEKFKNGEDPLYIFNLPYPIEGVSYVIFDGKVFYIKRGTRNIVKFDLKLRLRLKEGALPGGYFSGLSSDLNKVQLAVDEEGLWAIYMGSTNTGLIDISRINKKSLAAEKTWKTTYLQSSSLHSFLICGVLYVVGRPRGEIEYMYDTNVPSRGSGSVSVGFDQSRFIGSSHTRRKGHMFHTPKPILSPPSRSFLTYNFTSLTYNPRDRLLHAWDALRSRAVSYNLHFSPDDPDHGDGPSISTTPTASPTRTSSTNEQAATRSSSAETSNKDQTNVCPPLTDSGYEWPSTEADSAASVPCGSGRKDYALWLCLKDPKTLQAKWNPSGPNLTNCAAWYDVIESKLNKDVPDVILAARLLSKHTRSQLDVNSQTVIETSRLMEKIAQAAKSIPAPLTSAQSRQLAEDMVECEWGITRATSSWISIAPADKSRAIDNILTSMESVGAIMAASIANASNYVDERTESVGRNGVGVHAVVKDSQGSLSSPRRSQTYAVIPAGDARWRDGLSLAAFVSHNNLAKLVDLSLDKHIQKKWKIDSEILSVVVGPSGQHVQLSAPVKVHFKTGGNFNSERKCVYWKFSQSSSIALWSSDGCRMTSFNSSFVECSCDHVTSFAVLVNSAVKIPLTEPVKIHLDPLSIVGICFSLVCLLLSFLTFTCFGQLRSDRNSIHKHFCLTLFAAEALFLFGIDRTEQPLACAIVAGLLHYFFLSTFIWGAVEAFQLYITVMEMMEGVSRWVFYYLIGYGVPFVIVGVSALVNSGGYGSEEACWLKVNSGFIWSFVGPVCAVVLSNLVLLAITIAKLYRRSLLQSNPGKVEGLKTAVRGASILLCLLGITWAFGILWVWGKTPIMANLFCVFNAFLGLFVFIFHCLFLKKVRKEYKRLLGRCSCCRSKPRGSYVTDSMSFSKHLPSSRQPPSIACSSHPQRERLLFEDGREVPVHAMTLVSNRDPSIRADLVSNPLGTEWSHRGSADPEIRIFSNEDSGLFCSVQPSHSSDRMEDEAAYDHLEHHCHIDERSHVHHAGARRSAEVARCDNDASQTRSQTMSQLHPPHVDALQIEKSGAMQRWPPHKACTLSNMQSQEKIPHKELVLPYPRKNFEESSCPHHENKLIEEPYLVPSSHVLHYNGNETRQIVMKNGSGHCGERNRRSMTSSGSDDPIVNDLSSSSSTASKPSSIAGGMSVNPPAEACGRPFLPRFRDKPEDTERDENDLEVQRLTDPERCGEEDRENRDSAFCPSIMELESPLHRYSSTSSRCSGNIVDPRLVRHHVAWPENNSQSRSDQAASRPFVHTTDARHHPGQVRHLHGEGRQQSFPCRAMVPPHQHNNQYEFNAKPNQRTTCL